MKWEKVNNKQVAQGKYGAFIITKYASFYYATYQGKTNSKVFNFPKSKSIKILKEKCQDNWYWED